jgi:hypothetical protein
VGSEHTLTIQPITETIIKNVYFHLYEISRKGKITETETDQRLSGVVGGVGAGGDRK